MKVVSQPPFLEDILDKNSITPATTDLPYGYISFFLLL